MGPGRGRILYRRQLQEPPTRSPRRRLADYTESFANPYAAAERGFVDDVIDPTETQRKLTAVRPARTKREELPTATPSIPL